MDYQITNPEEFLQKTKEQLEHVRETRKCTADMCSAVEGATAVGASLVKCVDILKQMDVDLAKAEEAAEQAVARITKFIEGAEAIEAKAAF